MGHDNNEERAETRKRSHSDHAFHGDKMCMGHDAHGNDEDSEESEGGGGLNIGADIENINERAAYIHVIGDLI